MSRSAVDPALAAAAPGVEKVSLYERWKRIHPLWVEGGWQRWRRSVLVVLLLVFYASPWLRIDGEPGVRFDLVHRRFTLFWTTFVPEDFVLLDWLLLLAALLLFTVTIAAGRVFCGWACPQTVWSLTYFTIERFVEGDRNARLRLERGGWTAERLARKTVKIALWSALAFSIGLTLVAYFEDVHALLPRILRADLTKWEWLLLLLPAAGSFLLSGVLREQVCFHMCPYARFQSVMFDRDTLIIDYDAARGEPRGHRRRDADPASIGLGACVDCHKCVQVCPTGIDIRNGLQYQCIGCAACIDACTDVMATMGYGESLVRYSSQNREAGKPIHVLRPRLVGYATVLLLLFGAFGWAFEHRIPVALTVVRDRNRLYREIWDGRVENVYTLRVSNRGDAPRDYRVVVESALPVAYEGPAVIEVPGGSLRAVPVRLVVDADRAGAAEHAGEATTADVRFGLRAVDDVRVAVDEASRFYLPARRAP